MNTDALAGRNIAAHMGHEKLPEIDVIPIVKRVDSLEKAKAFHREAHKHGASREVKEQVQERMAYLKERQE